MKILLIQPPTRDFYRTSIRTQPIGLAYLAASLEREGHEVEILDCQTERKKSIPIPTQLSYLKDFYPFDDRSPFKLYTGYYHFGMDWEEVRKRIRNSKAEVFGISSSFTPYHGEALRIAQIIKDWDQTKVVVMGGAHVSCDPQSVLKSPLVDFAILGEGEVRLPLLLESIRRGGQPKNTEQMDGIGYRRGGVIRINPIQNFIQDLDSLPHPARELLDPDRYRIGKTRSTIIITSRGCPHGCAYCSAHLVMGRAFRSRTPEAVLKEMMECRKKYGIRIFDVEDDNFTFDEGRAKKLMSLVIENFGEGEIKLSAMNGVSLASLDEELLRLMKRAGFDTINLSFVSIDRSTRERLGRPGTAAQFDQIAEKARQTGLNIIGYAIMGMPGQTVGEMVDTLVHLMGKRVLIGPSVYYPTPGTPLFGACEREVVLPADLSQWRSTAFPIETKEFSRLDMLTLFRLSRVINFVKGKMDEKELDEGMTWRELFLFLNDRTKGMDENLVPYSDLRKSNAWVHLLLLLLEEKSFFSLKKAAGSGLKAGAQNCRAGSASPMGGLSFLKEMSSKKVLDYFIDKAWESPVLRSRNT